jgi:hypothetical protein
MLRSPIRIPLLLAILLAAAGCNDTPATPSVLADGSAPPPLPKAVERLGQGVTNTRVRVIAGDQLTAANHACVLSELGRALHARDVAVERIDALGSSITFRPDHARLVYGCTSGTGEPPAHVHWCGHIAGKLRGDTLPDPRLDIGCRTAQGDAIGSVWIDPAPKVRWIVVRDRSRIQVYATAGSLPVRVTTTAVDVEAATAVFKVEQYDGTGTRIAEGTLRTAVAG